MVVKAAFVHFSFDLNPKLGWTTPGQPCLLRMVTQIETLLVCYTCLASHEQQQLTQIDLAQFAIGDLSAGVGTRAPALLLQGVMPKAQPSKQQQLG